MANETVLVTGATGYIASWVVKYLLEDGYNVHATVRNKDNREKLGYLSELEEKYPEQLKLFNADLLKTGSFKEAMKGCTYVMHMASPFVISGIKDANKELVEPALEGTRNVLNTANEVSSVKRIVLTSSVVSVYGDAIDIEDTRKDAFDESCWNTTSSVNHQPYPYSKKVAEKEAWKIQSEQSNWDLVTINPGFVLGPSLTSRADSTSIDFMINLLNGKLKFGVPKLTFGVVDVRDVAKAHIEAIKKPQASGRYLLVSQSLNMKQIADILMKKYKGKYSIPKSELPNALLYAFGPLQGFSWKYIKRNVDKPLNFNNTKSKNELSINYIDPEKTILNHAEQIINSGLVK